MNHDTNQTDTSNGVDARSPLSPSAAILWASAFLIATLAIFQAGHLSPNPAFAGMATTTDEGFSLVTTSSGKFRAQNAKFRIQSAKFRVRLANFGSRFANSASGWQIFGPEWQRGR